MRASATCETGREGKGLMSMSEPVRASRSSCQPGKVARMRKVMKARTMATMLWKWSASSTRLGLMEGCSQQIGEDHTILERLRHPDQIQGILIDAYLLGE